MCKKICHDQAELISRFQRWFATGRKTITVILTVIYGTINIVKKKGHMIISLDTGKPTNKSQHSFRIRTLSILGIERSISILVKITKNLQQTSCILEKCQKYFF